MQDNPRDIALIKSQLLFLEKIIKLNITALDPHVDLTIHFEKLINWIWELHERFNIDKQYQIYWQQGTNIEWKNKRAIKMYFRQWRSQFAKQFANCFNDHWPGMRREFERIRDQYKWIRFKIFKVFCKQYKSGLFKLSKVKEKKWVKVNQRRWRIKGTILKAVFKDNKSDYHKWYKITINKLKKDYFWLTNIQSQRFAWKWSDGINALFSQVFLDHYSYLLELETYNIEHYVNMHKKISSKKNNKQNSNDNKSIKSEWIARVEDELEWDLKRINNWVLWWPKF